MSDCCGRRMEGGRRVSGPCAGAAPLVSVITVVYNGAASIERTIASVIGQAFPSFEYIVVDGGSEDGTTDLLKRYEGSIEYWASEPDKGIYDAMNRGISLARGEWLYFLGSDDVLAGDDVLASLFSRRRETKFIYGDVIYGDTGTVYGGAFTRHKLTKRNICQQGIFYRSDLFLQLGLFDTNYPLLADWLFNMRVFSLHDANPEHVDIVVAEYSLAGASNRITDTIFARDRLYFIREYLGLSCYIYARASRLRDQASANLRKYIARPTLSLIGRSKDIGR